MKRAVSVLLALGISLSVFASSAAAASTSLETVVDALVGVDYKYGGTTKNGFDCSGFTMFVFAKFGIDLPHQSGSQAQLGSKVDRSELKSGDLVFFNTSGNGISHVGIYMGGGSFAHASSSRGVIIANLDESYYQKRYVTARRILSGDQYDKVAVVTPEAE